MPQANKSHFSIFLESAMQKRQLTQASLAEHAKTSQSNISRYLRGIGMPRAEELHRISKALGVSMEWLLTGEAGSDSANPASLKFRQPNTAALKKTIAAAKAALEKAEAELNG